MRYERRMTESSCFDCRRRLGGYVIRNAYYAGDVADNFDGDAFEGLEGQLCRRCGSGIDALPAADLNLLAEVGLLTLRGGACRR